MPLYEYRCSQCDEHFEELQKLTDPVLVDCPVCHQPRLVRLISAAGFRLSGSGWYETDFKTGNQRNLAGDKGEQKPKQSSDTNKSKSSTTTEATTSKPAASTSSTSTSSDSD